MILYFSYYTRNTIYEEEVKRLQSSLDKFDLKYELLPINSLGNWQENTRIKPVLILSMLKKYPQHKLVYLDADAEIVKRPDLFETIENDIGLHQLDWSKYKLKRYRNCKEILSGTLFFNNSENCKNIVKSWINYSNKNRNVWDQRSLAAIVGNNFYNLPAAYCKIFDTMQEVADPVIIHYQTSRKVNKNNI